MSSCELQRNGLRGTHVALLGARVRSLEDLLENPGLPQLLPLFLGDSVTQQERHETSACEKWSVLRALGDVHEQHHHVVSEDLVLEAVTLRQYRIHKIAERLDGICLPQRFRRPLPVELQHVPEHLRGYE